MGISRAKQATLPIHDAENVQQFQTIFPAPSNITDPWKMDLPAHQRYNN